MIFLKAESGLSEYCVFKDFKRMGEVNPILLSFSLLSAKEYRIIHRSPYEILDFIILSGQSKKKFTLTKDKRTLIYSPNKPEEVFLLLLFKSE